MTAEHTHDPHGARRARLQARAKTLKAHLELGGIRLRRFLILEGQDGPLDPCAALELDFLEERETRVLNDFARIAAVKVNRGQIESRRIRIQGQTDQLTAILGLGSTRLRRFLILEGQDGPLDPCAALELDYLEEREARLLNALARSYRPRKRKRPDGADPSRRSFGD